MTGISPSAVFQLQIQALYISEIRCRAWKSTWSFEEEESTLKESTMDWSNQLLCWRRRTRFFRMRVKISSMSFIHLSQSWGQMTSPHCVLFPERWEHGSWLGGGMMARKAGEGPANDQPGIQVWMPRAALSHRPPLLSESPQWPWLTNSFKVDLIWRVSLKNLPAMQETVVLSLGQEDPLEKEVATHSSILAWRIPWTEEPGGL